MSARYCPCGAELTSEADLAHGVCHGCRVTAKKRVRRQPALPQDVGLFDEPEDADRRLVPLDGWPDYYSAGLT